MTVEWSLKRLIKTDYSRHFFKSQVHAYTTRTGYAFLPRRGDHFLQLPGMCIPGRDNPLSVRFLEVQLIQAGLVEYYCFLERFYVCCAWAFLTLPNFKLNLLTVFKWFIAFHLNFRVMNKQIFVIFIRRNKSKTLVRVKPLNCTCTHNLKSSN